MEINESKLKSELEDILMFKSRYELEDVKASLEEIRLTGSEREALNLLFRIVDAVIESEHNF